MSSPPPLLAPCNTVRNFPSLHPVSTVEPNQASPIIISTTEDRATTFPPLSICLVQTSASLCPFFLTSLQPSLNPPLSLHHQLLGMPRWYELHNSLHGCLVDLTIHSSLKANTGCQRSRRIAHSKAVHSSLRWRLDLPTLWQKTRNSTSSRKSFDCSEIRTPN